MGPAEDTSGHVTDALESYLLGELPETREFEVESHLLVCARCRAEADAASEVAVAVATLSAADVRAIEQAPEPRTPSGVPGGDGPPLAAAPDMPAFDGRGPAIAGAAPPRQASRQASSGAVNSGAASSGALNGERPRFAATTRPPDGRPGASRRSSRRFAALHLASVVLGAVLGVVAGVGVYAWIAPDGGDRVPAGSSTSTDTTSRRMSVTLADTAAGLEVRATVVGLEPGEDFDLVAVARDGRNYSVVRGAAAGGPQTLQGSVALTPDRILFFAVVQGEIVIVAPVP